MTIAQRNAAQAQVPGTWQNRQGRGDEWEVAPPAKAVLFFAVVAVFAVAACAVLVAVLA